MDYLNSEFLAILLPRVFSNPDLSLKVGGKLTCFHFFEDGLKDLVSSGLQPPCGFILLICEAMAYSIWKEMPGLGYSSVSERRLRFIIL